MSATIFQASVFEDGSFAVCGLLVNLDPAKTPLVQADITTIEYWITDTATKQFVPDHEAETLTIADVIYDTLQEWPDWPEEPGYNFLATFDSTAIPNGRRTYRIKIKVTLANSHVVRALGDLKALEVRPS